MLGQRGKSSQNAVFFSGKRHDNKNLKIQILLPTNFVVIAQAPTHENAHGSVHKDVHGMPTKVERLSLCKTHHGVPTKTATTVHTEMYKKVFGQDIPGTSGTQTWGYP